MIGLNSYDFLSLITHKITDFETIFNAGQTCTLWKRVVRDQLPEIIKYKRLDVCFKITKIRFLLDRYRPDISSVPSENLPLLAKMCYAIGGTYPVFQLEIYDYDWKNYSVFLIKPVSVDNDHIVYESDQTVINHRLKSLKWRILCPFFDVNTKETSYLPVSKQSDNVIIEQNTQIAPDDLCWQYFETGKRYQKEGEQVVIGSMYPDNAFHCCCAVILLPE